MKGTPCTRQSPLTLAAFRPWGSSQDGRRTGSVGECSGTLDGVRNVDWDRRYSDRGLLWSAEPNRFVAEELAGVTAGRALDLACGEGRNAIWLARRGWRVTAVDFSTVALDKARAQAERHGVEVDWMLADLLEHEPAAGAYDLVLLAYLQLPAAEMTAVLGAAARAVADGGTLLLVGHDLSNLTDGVGGPQDPRVLHTPESVVAALHGLTVVRAQRVRRPVDTDDGPRDAVDTLVRVTRTRP
jgi:SAM-dependent methyltransferase